EVLRSRRAEVRVVRLRRAEVPRRDVDVLVAGPRAAGTAAARRVAAARELRVAPGLRARAVELDPAPEAAELGLALRALAHRRGRVVAVERDADLPRVVRRTAAVRASRRDEDGRQGPDGDEHGEAGEALPHRSPPWVDGCR